MEAKSPGKGKRHYMTQREKVHLLGCFQASIPRPSDKNIGHAKNLGWRQNPPANAFLIRVDVYRQSGHSLLAELVPAFADRGCRVVSATDPYGSILGFLDRNSYFFFQVAPHLYSRD
jgi:hypothetical protein